MSATPHASRGPALGWVCSAWWLCVTALGHPSPAEWFLERMTLRQGTATPLRGDTLSGRGVDAAKKPLHRYKRKCAFYLAVGSTVSRRRRRGRCVVPDVGTEGQSPKKIDDQIWKEIKTR